MAALTTDRDTPQIAGVDFVYPAAALAKCFAGGLGVLNGGYLEPGSTATGLVAVGRIEEYVDNSAGGNGDLSVKVRRGVFRFANSAAADAITLADVGNYAYIVDDATVAKTDGHVGVGAATRSRAGRIEHVDAQGVWVSLGGSGLPAALDPARDRALLGVNKIHIPVSAGDLAGATGNVYRFVSPVAGTITKLTSVLEGALTVGDATITASIGGTPVTGGALTITQAGSAAGDIDTAVPSAANAVTAGQAVALTVAGANTATVPAMVMVEITY